MATLTYRTYNTTKIERNSIFKKIKEPGSAITHFIGMVAALFAAYPLLDKAHTREASPLHLLALTTFIASMILLYAASASYHSFDISKNANLLLKKFDHAMIFVLIAGSYTPICLIALQGKTGYSLLALVWSIAILGIIFKMCWVTCPQWLSSVLYISLGWACLFALPEIIKALSPAAFGWLLAGGIIYTIGGIIYALKLPLFNSRHKNFGTHEIFHLFVMGGSLCHFIVMYNLA